MVEKQGIINISNPGWVGGGGGRVGTLEKNIFRRTFLEMEFAGSRKTILVFSSGELLQGEREKKVKIGF